MPYRRLFVLAGLVSLVTGPRVAAAQFTTFIPPSHKAADSVKAAVVAQTKAQTDSAIKMQLTNMKTWVDSAAGLPPVPTAAADSLAAAPTSSARPDTTPAPVPTMRNATRAPATASALPMIAIIGAGSLTFGLILLAGQRPARARAKDGP